MWWAALLVIVFLALALRRTSENRAGVHALTVLAILAVLVLALWRMPAYPTLP